MKILYNVLLFLGSILLFDALGSDNPKLIQGLIAGIILGVGGVIKGMFEV